MKIIARHFGVWGNAKTQGFELEDDASVDDLKEMIFKRFQIPPGNQYLKYTMQMGDFKTTVLQISPILTSPGPPRRGLAPQILRPPHRCAKPHQGRQTDR